MTMQSILASSNAFVKHLGMQEEPFGVFFADAKPEKAIGPKVGAPISRELEAQGKVNMQEVFASFSCVMRNVWLARKQHCAAFLSAQEYGCIGGVYYCSMMRPNLAFIENYVSTGISGTPVHGERYMPNPESVRRFLAEIDPRPAPAKYCIFKPLSLFADGELPEFVIFFARPEVLTGLFTHTVFTTGETDCVVSPFGAGCTNMLAWPSYYQRQGLEKAVLGGFDPSARKYIKPDELTFTVPLSLYEKMLAALPESMFQVDGEWKNVRKKIARSAKAWGEEAQP